METGTGIFRSPLFWYKSSMAKLSRGIMKTAVWLYRRSGGKMGGKMRKAPVLLLTTTGRKSGLSWTNPLIYQPDGDGWVIIASNGGKPRHPAWWLNLRAQPEATIEIGRDSYPVTASEVDEANRDRLWQSMTAVYPGYDKYVAKTSRHIPVVHLARR
jgi:deazaflavin-dependent oxidoreductase (nitroreductase family)